MVKAAVKSLLRRVLPRPLWERLRQARIARQAKGFDRRVVNHVYGGEPLAVLLADTISVGWYDHDWAPLAEIELLRKGRLAAGATVFDLGAHQGVVALLLARAVGPAGRVVAVEGMAHNCEVAGENRRLNAADNVVVRHAVVADKPGTVRFFEGLNGAVALHGIGRDVEAVTIDHLADQYGAPSVVFVDVEGFEVRALHGAIRTLATPCDWFIEVHVDAGLESYGGSAAQVLEFFPESDFERWAWRLDSHEQPRRYVPGDRVVNARFALVALYRAAGRELRPSHA